MFASLGYERWRIRMCMVYVESVSLGWRVTTLLTNTDSRRRHDSQAGDRL